MESGNSRQPSGRHFAFFLTLLFAVIFWVSHPLPADAQSFEGQTILSLEVNSRMGITIETISRYTGIRTGIPYSSKTIRQSLDSLYATGLFTDIRVETEPILDGVAVIYNLTEKSVLAELKIKGNRVFWDRTLTEAMGLKVGEEVTEEMWKSSIDNLLDFLQRKGHLRARVHTEASEVPRTNQVRITVRVNEGDRTRIRETRFSGDTIFSGFRLWSRVRLKGGEFYDADLLEKDVRRLENLYHENGYLRAEIGPPEIAYHESTNEVDITIPIIPRTRLKIVFDGNDPFGKGKLLPHLLFREEKSYDDVVFRASADQLVKFYRSKGYPFVAVSYTTKALSEENLVQATFIIQSGSLSCLRSVLFAGNAFFPSDLLRDFIETRPGGRLKCEVLDEEKLREDVKTIRSRYLEQGFQQVKVEPRVAYNEDKTRSSLIFAIAEGPRTVISDIQFEGNQALSSDLLRETIEMGTGQPYDTIPVRKDQERLLALYSQHGYVYALIEPHPVFSKDRSQVSIRYRIQEDEQVSLGRILLSGNAYTKDHVILRELLIKPGDPYNEALILISRHRIQRLGYLGNVRFEPIRPISLEAKEPIKDMRLRVQERPTKTLDLGIGYADVERLRGFIEGTHRNLWGTGRSLSLRAEGSQIENRYSTTYREPWILGYKIDGRLVVFHQVRTRDTYELITTGGSAGLEKQFTPTVRASIRYQFENNIFPEAVTVLPEDERANIASLNPSIIWDTRNDPFNPTSGFLNSLTFRDAALILGSQIQLIKVTARSSWFVPITRWLVFAVSARGGAADRFGETAEIKLFGEPTDLVPPNERFFLGGRSTVRGYDQDALGVVVDPKDCPTGSVCGTILTNEDKNGVEFIGGNAMLLFNAELRFFLPVGLGLVLFHDRGNVFRNYTDVDLSLLKSTIGGGIWYGTPVGPLRIDYGYKLNREDNLCPECPLPVEESSAEVHFTLGFSF